MARQNRRGGDPGAAVRPVRSDRTNRQRSSGGSNNQVTSTSARAPAPAARNHRAVASPQTARPATTGSRHGRTGAAAGISSPGLATNKTHDRPDQRTPEEKAALATLRA